MGFAPPDLSATLRSPGMVVSHPTLKDSPSFTGVKAFPY